MFRKLSPTQLVRHRSVAAADSPGHSRAAPNNAFAQSTGRGRQSPGRPGRAWGTYCRIYASLFGQKRMNNRYLHDFIACAYMWSESGLGWRGLQTESTETDHNGLVGDRFTTRLLIAPEFYVHVIASLPYRVR